MAARGASGTTPIFCQVIEGSGHAKPKKVNVIIWKKKKSSSVHSRKRRLLKVPGYSQNIVPNVLTWWNAGMRGTRSLMTPVANKILSDIHQIIRMCCIQRVLRRHHSLVSRGSRCSLVIDTIDGLPISKDIRKKRKDSKCKTKNVYLEKRCLLN